MVVPKEGGFALFSIPAVRERQGRSHSLYIRNMNLSHPKESLVYTANFLGEKPVPVIAYSLYTRNGYDPDALLWPEY